MKRCFKCRQKAHAEWRICSDGPWRHVCKDCDVELNKIALKWAYPETWKPKLEAYKRRASA